MEEWNRTWKLPWGFGLRVQASEIRMWDVGMEREMEATIRFRG